MRWRCTRRSPTGSAVAEAHNWLGLFNARKITFLDAIAQFQQAIDLNPEYLTHIHLGLLSPGPNNSMRESHLSGKQLLWHPRT